MRTRNEGVYIAMRLRRYRHRHPYLLERKHISSYIIEDIDKPQLKWLRFFWNNQREFGEGIKG